MRQSISSLAAFTRPYPWMIPAIVVLGLAASVAEGVGIGLLIPLLDSVLGASSEPSGPFATLMQQLAGIGQPQRSLLWVAVFIVLLILAKTLIVAGHLWLTTLVAGRVTRDLRVSLMERLLAVDYRRFAALDQGQLVNVVDTQTQRAGDAITLLGSLLVCACNVAVFGLLLFLLSWQMAVLVVILAMPVFLIVRSVSDRAHVHGREFARAQAAMSGEFLDILNAMRVVRIFGREAAELERFRTSAKASYRSFFGSELLAQLIQPFSELLYVPAFLAVFAYASYADVGVSSLLAFLLLLYRMQPPLKRLDQARVLLAAYAPGIGDVTDLLDRCEAQSGRSGTISFQELRDSIEFDRVSFAYGEGGAAAVRDVSFRIRRGQMVAIVGRSGAGKTTLVNLLCRLYEPQSGQIRVDGVPLGEIELDSWRLGLGLAGQDAELLGRSVAENLRFGRPEASDADMEQAAANAQADRFIRELSAGYGTVIGPRGSTLSGGQRQRLALARAFIRNPSILILDEATNAVDNVTEVDIRDSISQLAGRCTIIVIAHRMNTVRGADQVIVLSEGCVVECGKPEEVIRLAGEFSRLYELE